MTRTLKLYTTTGCHLCEEAAAMITKLATADIELTMVEVSESEKLMDDYGLRIPVIQFEHSSDELPWPFSEAELQSFLQSGLNALNFFG